jgi:hypothetical protein
VTEAEGVFDGDLLQARLWLPDRPTTALYVTFRQWDPEPGQFDTTGRVQRALTAGFAHLHIQTRWNDWFLNAETPALETALKTVRARFLTARAWVLDGRLCGVALFEIAAPQLGPRRLAAGLAAPARRRPLPRGRRVRPRGR